MITSFSGQYRFLSNFWPCKVFLEGEEYPSVEHAYVASKVTDHELRKLVASKLTPGDAKRLGRKLPLRPDWDAIKLDVMKELLVQKFIDPELAEKLVATGDQELIEGNTWGDTFWGVCDGVGENNLGKLLMEIRAFIR